MVSPKDTARNCISQGLSYGQLIDISLDMGCPEEQAVKLLVTRRENFAGGGTFATFLRKFPCEVLPS